MCYFNDSVTYDSVTYVVLHFLNIFHVSCCVQIAQIQHAYVRYDLDDPHFKQRALVFRRKTMAVKVNYALPSLSADSDTAPAFEPASNAHTHAQAQAEDSEGSKDTSTHGAHEQNSHSTDHNSKGAGGADTSSVHDGAAAQEPVPAPAPVERKQKHAPFRAFVAAGGTLAAAQGQRLMQDIELVDLLN